MKATSQFIDINVCLSNRKDLDALIQRAAIEKARVEKEMVIADRIKRSDRREWKARYLALVDLERALGYLAVNVTVTQTIPVL